MREAAVPGEAIWPAWTIPNVHRSVVVIVGEITVGEAGTANASTAMRRRLLTVVHNLQWPEQSFWGWQAAPHPGSSGQLLAQLFRQAFQGRQVTPGLKAGRRCWHAGPGCYFRWAPILSVNRLIGMFFLLMLLEAKKNHVSLFFPH
jgi:hypothetical protein